MLLKLTKKLQISDRITLNFLLGILCILILGYIIYKKYFRIIEAVTNKKKHKKHKKKEIKIYWGPVLTTKTNKQYNKDILKECNIKNHGSKSWKSLYMNKSNEKETILPPGVIKTAGWGAGIKNGVPIVAATGKNNFKKAENAAKQICKNLEKKGCSGINVYDYVTRGSPLLKPNQKPKYDKLRYREYVLTSNKPELCISNDDEGMSDYCKVWKKNNLHKAFDKPYSFDELSDILGNAPIVHPYDGEIVKPLPYTRCQYPKNGKFGVNKKPTPAISDNSSCYYYLGGYLLSDRAKFSKETFYSPNNEPFMQITDSVPIKKKDSKSSKSSFGSTSIGNAGSQVTNLLDTARDKLTGAFKK